MNAIFADTFVTNFKHLLAGLDDAVSPDDHARREPVARC